MNQPSLRAHPVMGLSNKRPGVAELLTSHRHVYFSDLRSVSAPDVTLADRLFYGCWIGPETFTPSTLRSSAFVCCVGAGDMPSDGAVRQAIADVEGGSWERMLELLRHPDALAPEILEYVMAVAAVGTLDARMEIRLSTMTLLGRLLRERPTLGSKDVRNVVEAFLLYCAADASDMVYYDAVALVDELAMSPEPLEQLIRRARSFDPRERLDAIIARGRMTLGVHRTELPELPLADLLDDPDPAVQLELLSYLSQNVRNSYDVRDLVPGVDLAAKLNRFLTSPDRRIRKAAVQYAKDVGGSVNRQALTEALTDPDGTLRDLAFVALYWVLFDDEVRNFLLHNEFTPTQYALVREYEAHWRAKWPSSSRIADSTLLRSMLASTDASVRYDALRLAGFTADPDLAPDIEAALRDSDSRVRAEADRLHAELRR